MTEELKKTCKVHGELKLADIYIDPSKTKICRFCKRLRSKEYKLKNKEKIRILNNRYQKAYMDRNRERLSIRRKELRAEQRKDPKFIKIKAIYNKRYKEKLMKNIGEEACLSLRRASKNRTVEQLTDGYVRGIICTRSTLKSCDIPDDLIVLQRAILMAKREVKTTMEKPNGN